ELKIRLIYLMGSVIITFLTAYYYSEEIFYLLAKPLTIVDPTVDIIERNFIYTNIAEVFLTYVKISFAVSVYFCLPIAFYQCWAFLLPGLYCFEQKQLRQFCINLFVLLTCGGFVGYYFIIPFAWKFFVGFETSLLENILQIKFNPKVNQYFDSILLFFIVLGLGVQLPACLIYLVKMKLITTDFLMKSRSIFYFFCLVLGTLFSPPDLFSQILIATWLIIFYELSLLLGLYLKELK
ncbi:MAG: twin-arginine translocase subunit TatC, partial [Nanoarchaeota archaeon]|nr:twin-arginine translocase subunit TatC [Nanoarchaeota archaeon]